MATPALMLAGATGLVGKQALERLLRAGNWTVCVPARSDLGVRHARLQVAVGDLDNAATLARIEGDLPTLDAFACAIGTTLKKAGSAAAFAAVDRDMVLALANLARRRGARHAVVVSSVGAVAGSSNLYLRVKGEMEAGIEALGSGTLRFPPAGAAARRAWRSAVPASTSPSAWRRSTTRCCAGRCDATERSNRLLLPRRWWCCCKTPGRAPGAGTMWGSKTWPGAAERTVRRATDTVRRQGGTADTVFTPSPRCRSGNLQE
ncbi:MAG: NAD(P)H-binding protein [Rhodanobacteraceae bacterium]|nr:NAD(P)H-binding protein [Rhodanobacteraceae bacterium]